MKTLERRLSGIVCGSILAVYLSATPTLAQIPGVAQGIPEPAQRNVIVQLFNWKFTEIKQEIPTLKTLGYSHIHVSPPEKSVEINGDWWERYQPVDFTVIDGPLGSENDFKDMIEVAHSNGMQIIADVVLNHTVDISTPFGKSHGATDASGHVTKYDLPDFTTANFHDRCNADSDAEKCWLSDDLMDLRTETDEVRQVAKAYLKKLSDLGADGFRFDAARNIEQGFFPAVMTAATGKYAFGEFVSASAQEFGSRPADMDYYDFPLAATMKGAFAFGGDLGILTHPDVNQALQGADAVTFVRNHDLAYNQVDSHHGIGQDQFGIGWDGSQLNHADVVLAYAFILAREEGLPYVFVGMKGAPSPSNDPDNDPDIIAAIRFHNLCLQGQGGVRRPDNWFLSSQTAIALTRGNDRFGIINKAADFMTTVLPDGLQPGTYMNVRTGGTIQVQQGNQIEVNGRTAAFFVKV